MRYLIVLLLSLLAMRPGVTEEVSVYDRFELWTDCEPLKLYVNFQKDDENEIDLTKEDIEIAVRSRLRSARMYTDELSSLHLAVNVNVVGLAFGIDIELYKIVSDFLYSKEILPARTWQSGITGTHSMNGNYILQTVSQDTDRFIDEYLRVNADSC